MSDRFDIFDSFGDKIGEIAPSDSGAGCLVGIFFFLLQIALWLFGFLIYALFWLTKRGAEAAIEKKWGKAFAFWALPLILLGCIFTVSAMSGMPEKQQKKETVAQVELPLQKPVPVSEEKPQKEIVAPTPRPEELHTVSPEEKDAIEKYVEVRNEGLGLLEEEKWKIGGISPKSSDDHVNVTLANKLLGRDMIIWLPTNPDLLKQEAEYWSSRHREIEELFENEEIKKMINEIAEKDKYEVGLIRVVGVGSTNIKCNEGINVYDSDGKHRLTIEKDGYLVLTDPEGNSTLGWYKLDRPLH